MDVAQKNKRQKRSWSYFGHTSIKSSLKLSWHWSEVWWLKGLKSEVIKKKRTAERIQSKAQFREHRPLKCYICIEDFLFLCNPSSTWSVTKRSREKLVDFFSFFGMKSLPVPVSLSRPFRRGAAGLNKGLLLNRNYNHFSQSHKSKDVLNTSSHEHSATHNKNTENVAKELLKYILWFFLMVLNMCC